MNKTRRRVKRKKRGTNLFVKYFSVSALTVFFSFVFIAMVMVFFIAVQWWTDKVEVLSGNADDIVAVYEDSADKGHNEELITSTLRIMSQATASDYFITDVKGDAFYCGDCESVNSSYCETHQNIVVGDEILDRAVDGGFSDYITDDTFGIGRFVVAKPVTDENGQVECIVFAVEDAITGLVPYVASVAKAFFYSMLLTLALVFIAIYFTARGITKPLGEMQEATEHFARGDFEYKANEDYKKRDFRDFAKALNKMAYELKIDDEAQKSFIANVSHELKTPMTSIGGFIDGILDGTIPPQEEKRYLSIVSVILMQLLWLPMALIYTRYLGS